MSSELKIPVAGLSNGKKAIARKIEEKYNILYTKHLFGLKTLMTDRYRDFCTAFYGFLFESGIKDEIRKGDRTVS